MTRASEKIIDSSVKAKATRLSFGEELVKLGADNERIVALDADLSKSTRTDLFAEKFPKRFFNMGIAEANMIGVAAGLASAGLIPYAASFGCFLTGRYDQIRMSVAFSGANVRLVGTHAGVAIGEDGHSQMALEDLGMMRSLPNMTVFQPADEYDTKAFMAWSVGHVGPCYLRLTRQNLPALKRSPSNTNGMVAGKWELLHGADSFGDAIVILATGGCVAEAVGAVDLLEEKGFKVVLVNANWIRPYDEMFLSRCCEQKPKLIVTVEDHYRVGGLGGAVAEFLSSQGGAPKLLRIGVEGFGQSGSPKDNMNAYGLSAEPIFKKIASVAV